MPGFTPLALRTLRVELMAVDLGQNSVGSGVSNPTLNAGSERIPLYPSWILRLTEQLDDRVG